MLKFLESYSFSEVMIFIVIFALAIKELITLYDWAKERLKRVFVVGFEQQQQEDKTEDKIKELNQKIDTISNRQAGIDKDIARILAKIDMLIDSDKDDIKLSITEKHHYFCYEKGYIDDYSLDCLEKKYGHYCDEGGNSFIGDLMKDLRALPKKP